MTVVRANAECLLERLSQLGPGAGAAAKWRQSALELEDRRCQDKQAFVVVALFFIIVDLPKFNQWERRDVNVV